MSHEKKLQHDELDTVNEALSKSEQFIEKYQKQVLIGLAIIIVLVCGYLAVRHFYILPNQEKAQEEMIEATFLFDTDSFEAALNGDGQNMGFADIAKQYNSTPAGNLANAYAGICAMRLGKNDEAIAYFKNFKADDILVQPAILGAIGICMVDMDQTKEAISYFEKAAKKADNSLISPIYLKNAGEAYEAIGDFKSAVIAYQTILDKYPMSMEGTEIERNIERAKANQK